MIITIDGPIATGKSTIAKRLAKEIGYIYFDTGAMYRSLTYAMIKAGVSPKDPQAVEAFLKTFDLDIKIKHGSRLYYANGEDVTGFLRSPEVTANVSEVSALPAVREKLLVFQRELSKGVNVVFEGRDMGTTVFPDADLKIFLTGRLEVRAQRRCEELHQKFPEMFKDLTLEQCMKDIQDRDHSDMTRELSPLRKADDAVEVDTSDLTLDEVVEAILDARAAKKTHHK